MHNQANTQQQEHDAHAAIHFITQQRRGYKRNPSPTHSSITTEANGRNWNTVRQSHSKACTATPRMWDKGTIAVTEHPIADLDELLGVFQVAEQRLVRPGDACTEPLHAPVSANSRRQGEQASTTRHFAASHGTTLTVTAQHNHMHSASCKRHVVRAQRQHRPHTRRWQTGAPNDSAPAFLLAAV